MSSSHPPTRMRRPLPCRSVVIGVLLLVLLPASSGSAAPGWSERSASVAALQIGLRVYGVYQGTVDGTSGSATTAAVREFQRRFGLHDDGVVGPRTRAALGLFGRPALGSRVAKRGNVGWDVAELQFRLAVHGFPSGAFDGRFGPRLDGALRRFQRWAAIAPTGQAGHATVAALATAPPRVRIAFRSPSVVAPSDGFGPRGDRFHSGIDYPASAGSPVVAAASGRVTWAARLPGGWGRLVVLAHGGGLRTLYAHLSRIDVVVGQRLAAGTRLGLVGASGRSNGPHLHFEARIRGAAVDPSPALP